MESQLQKELDDYLDTVRKVLNDFAWQLAKEHHNQMYAKFHQLNSERNEIVAKVERIEAAIKELQKKKGVK